MLTLVHPDRLRHHLTIAGDADLVTLFHHAADDPEAEFEDRPRSAAGDAGTPELRLGAWDGPLDLLLELARARKVDLSRLSILDLAEQFGAALEAAVARRLVPLPRLADWLVRAAHLARLRRLLPGLKEGAALERFLPETAADWHGEALQSRAALASTLLAGPARTRRPPDVRRRCAAIPAATGLAHGSAALACTPPRERGEAGAPGPICELRAEALYCTRMSRLRITSRHFAFSTVT